MWPISNVGHWAKSDWANLGKSTYNPPFPLDFSPPPGEGSVRQRGAAAGSPPARGVFAGGRARIHTAATHLHLHRVRQAPAIPHREPLHRWPPAGFQCTQLLSVRLGRGGVPGGHLRFPPAGLPVQDGHAAAATAHGSAAGGSSHQEPQPGRPVQGRGCVEAARVAYPGQFRRQWVSGLPNPKLNLTVKYS